ncbi:Rieske 2Fe-2S domain-containing protein [Rhodocaloribacter litoris]|uniref:QcrA and Rieske domain-containing protein n=1 Tax=Rhodocaloribacter litoris TaxID=2558931 RepID=UPI001420F164|nr:Rieske 2Fe-2S domain-containing protein [Rhodocaloribacter litoris]QXD15203.1 Rieske 2Fe-2S domain-containing protein [Rhodocaloribacter litoris]GIV60434.1 MAG: hypothetical protein KatS3mg043_1523 [Rhodothermaceae bacterium]
MHRRDFIRWLERLAAGVACAGGGLLAGCAGSRFVPARPEAGRLVIRKDDLAGRAVVLVDLPGTGRPILLRRTGPDAFVAVWTRCTHRGCQVEPAGDRLVCPCHGSEYTLDGKVVKSPARMDLRRFRVTTDAGHVYVEMN